MSPLNVVKMVHTLDAVSSYWTVVQQYAIGLTEQKGAYVTIMIYVMYGTHSSNVGCQKHLQHMSVFNKMQQRERLVNFSKTETEKHP